MSLKKKFAQMTEASQQSRKAMNDMLDRLNERLGESIERLKNTEPLPAKVESK